MANIHVQYDFDSGPSSQFTVHVSGEGSTKHVVTVDRPYYDQLTAGRVTMETLIEASFKFLLEREPKESILRSFNLREIQHHFPEYEEEIGRLRL